MTLANKITFLYGGLFAVVLCLTSAFFLANAVFFYRDITKKELDQTANKIAEYIQGGGSITENEIRDLNPNKFVSIRVYGLTDRKQLVPASEVVFPVPPPDNLYDGSTVPRERPFFITISDKASDFGYMSDIKFVNYNAKRYLIQVFRQYYKEQKIISFFAIVFVCVNVLGIIGAFLVGRYISKVMLRPIADITKMAGQISIEDLSKRLNVYGPDDELKRLSITFNNMIGRLEQSFKKQTQFISDASHELRTPISVIQGYASLIDRWGKRDEAILQESIDSIKAETAHMGMLVKKLLLMANNDQNKTQMQVAEVSLNKIVADVVKEIGVLDYSADINVEQYANDDAVILADYDLVKQMLWVFLENSLKYTKRDGDPGRIDIRIFSEGDRICVSIKDNGIGIAEADLPFIFERFYRADKARGEVKGSGLGLSIAAWIMKQHNATYEVFSKLDSGTEIIVKFVNAN